MKDKHIFIITALMLAIGISGCISLDLGKLNPTYGYGYHVVKKLTKIDGGYKIEFNDFYISTDALGK